MVIITNKLKIPKQILTVFSVTIISLGLFLTQASFDSLSKSFGQYQTQLKIKHCQRDLHNLAPLKNFLQSKKMLRQTVHVHSYLP